MTIEFVKRLMCYFHMVKCDLCLTKNN
uniref:Uncharacterized protein n=1 Tax=Arundo donax TaxID=35708 RepID=A0A0A8Z5C2_ARUDO